MIHTLHKWFLKWRKKIGLVAVGHASKQVEEIIFDWLIYGAVVGWTTAVHGPLWGLVVGFLIMAPLSALVSLIYIRLYDWAKIDLFGFEMLKEYKEEIAEAGFWKRLVKKILKWGDVPAFFLLSINGDPFFVTVYLRKIEHRYKKLSNRDWFIFWSSVVVSNGYWTLRWIVIIALAKWILSLVPIVLH